MNFAVFNHVWHVLQNVPFSSMWMTSCTLVATTFGMSSRRNFNSVFQSVAAGTEISFLKRRILRVEDGLALLPGSSIGKLIKVWEEKFGKLRSSTTPADPRIQTEDNSPCLVGSDVTFFRMAVGTCLYITRDRPDVAFTGEGTVKLHEQPHSFSNETPQEACGLLEGNQQLCSCTSTTSWRTRLAQTNQ